MGQAISLSFTETMKGQIFPTDLSLDFPMPLVSFTRPKDVSSQSFAFTLTISISDIDRFCNDPELKATAAGEINCDIWDQPLKVKNGEFNLFTRPTTSAALTAAKEMHYLLNFEDPNGKPYCLYGFKNIEREDLEDAWDETTTLYCSIYAQHLTAPPSQKSSPVYLGILHIKLNDFIEQMRSFESNAPNFPEKVSAMTKFMNVFVGSLWEAYAPFVFGTDESRWGEHIIPLNSYAGIKNANVESHNLYTEDGIHLTMDRFLKKECKDVVLLLHGLTTSTDMYIMPEHFNLVQYLLDNGFEDVWSLDWRGSNRYPYNLKPFKYTIDDVALYDVPAAIGHLRQRLGEDVNIHVICHCVGSISFMSSLALEKVKGIKSVISNSVSLNPKIRWQSRIKLSLGPFVLERLMGYPYISPEMPYFPGPGFGKWIFWMERTLRRECKEPACHMISFMWGWGFPAAYEHRNLNPITHRRLKDLFGGTNLHWYRHILKMVKAGFAKPFDKQGAKSQLPDNYCKNAMNISWPPTLFVSGDKNKIFPGANKLTYEKLKANGKDVEYHEFKNYGHQDVLMGKYCAVEVFPKFLEFLRKHKA